MTITVRLAFLELRGSMLSLKQRLSWRHALVKVVNQRVKRLLLSAAKRIANAFVLISSLTPEMDLARLLSVRDWRGALAFKPDSLAAVSLSGDQLSARTDYTWDTDAVSGECFDS